MLAVAVVAGVVGLLVFVWNDLDTHIRACRDAQLELGLEVLSPRKEMEQSGVDWSSRHS